MACDCFIILRSIGNREMVVKTLQKHCEGSILRIVFSPDIFRALCYFEQIGPTDLVLEPHDVKDPYPLGILLEQDDVPNNGITPSAPLQQRLQIVQNLIQLCLQNASSVEMYLTSQMPRQDEYETYYVTGDQVAKLLWEQYQACPLWDPYVPDLHLIVLK